MPSQLSVLDVAQYILARADQPMSTMKLQKLTYYCQAWYSTWNQRRLFREDFAAWANGPVCRVLYNEHKGRFSVTSADLRSGDPDRVPATVAQALDRVLDAYQPLSGMQLSDMTHSEAPWREARGGLPDGVRSEALISVESMQAYYGRIAADPRSTNVGQLETPPAR